MRRHDEEVCSFFNNIRVKWIGPQKKDEPVTLEVISSLNHSAATFVLAAEFAKVKNYAK